MVRRFVLVLLPGCLFPSLEGLSGDASTSDAAMDSSTDVQIVDAALDVIEAAGPFCPQTNAVLCSDFDETDDAGFEGAWDYIYAPGTTTFEESTAFSTSAPRSLLVATTNADPGALARKAVGYTNGVTLEFDVRIIAEGSNPSVAFFSIGAGGLTLQPRATQTNISESTNLADGGTSYDGTSVSNVIPTNTWVHVIYDFDRKANKLTATIDGTVIITYTPSNGAWGSATNTTAHIGVGSSPNETVYYDDVTIRTR